ncbi:DNA cytosine methyltransferase [Janthinobacterium violaceinigrum]|uniref:DNA (cytosine-5-)-methyltransferase n=2 Tax=Janthinobacterium violaceinigrum TaxID=2654252 RepID=A0A6I1I9J1_9BURK|nr:DNA cytosine methyltransferase [Janthinobacterium violaceinigrum]
MPISFGSVCSGLEAASVAWGPLGWRAAWLAEIEPFPCAVLAHHYPDVPNLGDMTKVAALIRDGFVPAPDVFCGGTPCQAFSIAGLRNSLDDERGNLSLVFCEIADEIDARRAAAGLLPTVVFWENVPGVLSTKDNAFGCFLAGLAGEDDPIEPPGGKWANAGCVYGPKRTVAWRILDAQYFGVAQRRRRVFVIASAGEGFDPAQVLFEFDGVRRDTAPSRQAGQDAAGAVVAGADYSCPDAGWEEIRGATTQAFGGGKNCNPTEVGTALTAHPGGRYDLDNETFLVQPIAYPVQNATRGKGQNGLGIGDADAPMYTLDNGSQHGVAQAVSYAPQAGALRMNPNSGPDGVGVQEHIAYTLEARAEVQAVAFSCKDHGADATVELAPTMRAMGHQGSHANAGGQLAVCITGDVMHTLKAEGFDASEDGTGRGQPIVPSMAFCQNTRDEVRLMGGDGEISGALSAQPGMKQTTYVAPGMAVRRLTPRECERLQDFPDDYTLIPFGRKIRPEKLDQDWIKYLMRGGVMSRDQVARAAADGPRYKAIGNSWAVSNVAWLGRRIDAAARQLRA